MFIRNPIVAGQFYEGSSNALCNYVQTALGIALQKKSPPKKVTPASLALLPHAGHFFCGHVIAETLVEIELPKTLILLGPNHTGRGKPLSVWHTGAWQTPLGNVSVDTELAEEIILSNSGFTADTEAHLNEHSLEVILPFLQIKIPELRIVPIAIASRDLNVLKRAGHSLGNIIANRADQKKDVAIIVSSDLHHFSDHNTTLDLDMLALKAFMDFDPCGLASVVSDKQISMCGVCPAVVGLYALEKAEPASRICSLVNHTTSFEKNHDPSRVVGYAGLHVNKSTCHSA